MLKESEPVWRHCKKLDMEKQCNELSFENNLYYQQKTSTLKSTHKPSWTVINTQR